MAFLDEIGLSYFWKGILAKMKSDCAPASHIKDKQNPHKVTAEQVGALPLNGGTMTGPIKGITAPTTDDMPTPKSYVDNAIANAATKPKATKITLSASGWDSSAKTQTITVAGILADETKQLIMPMPAVASMSSYNKAGIQMTGRADGSVTFTADTVPSVAVDVWVVVQEVDDVTPPPLSEATWDVISQQSLAGNAKNIWAVGDCKAVKLSGTASKLSLDTTLYVYILDFDHDKSSASGAADGITFGTFKTAASNGIDVCLVSGYSDDSDFRMNTTATNSGGWKNSDMRYNILGSTNTQNGDATSTTATSPRANTLMSCLPSDLRAVMRPMYIYTDNTGGGSDTASYVTGTLDYLPLLAEYEVHGARSYANSAERNNQTQYAYYKNGNSKKKFNHSSTSSAVTWWVRSPYYIGSNYFCIVNTSGNANRYNAYRSLGVAPAFKV
ncbi:MAG: hypothetical protein KH138_11435 [Firmicutes bacterium]|nr:hypothetical protein [Bacillota bacterium]